MAIARNDTTTLFAEGTASTLRLIAYLGLAALLMVLDHRAGYLETLRRLAISNCGVARRKIQLPIPTALKNTTSHTENGAEYNFP